MAVDTPRELLANLLKRREELRIESEALDKLIETYKQMAMLSDEPARDQLEIWHSSRSRSAKSEYVAKMLKEVRRQIIGQGAPLTRSELVKKLESVGYLVDGRDKAKVLGTNIWRSGKFHHIEGRGYWPNDVPMPR
jgi:hypothetical protein